MKRPKHLVTRPYVILQPSLVHDVADLQIGDRVPDLHLFHQNMLIPTQCTPAAH